MDLGVWIWKLSIQAGPTGRRRSESPITRTCLPLSTSNLYQHLLYPTSSSRGQIDAAMLALSMHEAIRRGAWTCFGSPAVCWSPQALVASSAVKQSDPKHQRKHSSSKASSSSKDETRSINSASQNATPAVPPAAKRSGGRRPSRPISKPSATKARPKAYPNIPSVPSTHHLHPMSKEIPHSYPQKETDIFSRCPRRLIFLSSPADISNQLLPSSFLRICLLLHLRPEDALTDSSLRRHQHSLLCHRQPRKCSIPRP